MCENALGRLVMAKNLVHAKGKLLHVTLIGHVRCYVTISIETHAYGKRPTSGEIDLVGKMREAIATCSIKMKFTKGVQQAPYISDFNGIRIDFVK